MSPNSVSPTDNYVTSASTTSGHIYNNLQNYASTPRNPSSRYEENKEFSRYSTSGSTTRNPSIPTMSSVNDIFSTTSVPTYSTTFFPPSSQSSSYVHFTSNNAGQSTRTSSVTSGPTFTGAASENLILDDFQGRSTVPSFLDSTPNSLLPAIQESMTTLFRREGLFAMSKYLRQSGLDNVLNETGEQLVCFSQEKVWDGEGREKNCYL